MRVVVKNFVICCVFVTFVLSGCAKVSDNLLNNVAINDHDVTGMTEDELHEYIEKTSRDLILDIEYTFYSDDTEKTLSAQSLGIKFDTESAFNEATANDIGGSSRDVNLKLMLDDNTALKSLKTLAIEFNTEPKAATAEYKDGKFTFNAPKSGARVDEKYALSSLKNAIKSGKSERIELKFTEIKPEKSPTIDELKSNNTLLASYTTSFAKSPYDADNRVFNIKKAAQLTDGYVLAPGKEFDTNAVLGDRNDKNGWEKAPAIYKGEYRLEYGGGVCQLSSTLYNCVLEAELKVTERTPHSKHVGYVPKGRDATISTGGPNFKFVNTTDYPITVGAIINSDKKELTVLIFGRSRGSGS